jgi:hypothetical protein
MKQMRILATWLAAFSVALAMASSASAQSSKPRVGTVTKIKGAARVSSGNNIWRPLKVGDQLRAGTVVQTAGGSYVDIAFGEGGASADSAKVTPAKARGGIGAAAGGGAGGGGGKVAAKQDVIRMSADTVLAIDRLSSINTGADRVSETQLDLRSGKIFGSVAKQSAASRFEVKIPNGVAGIRGTTFSLTADGVVSVLDGTVIVAWTPAGHPADQPPPTKTVPEGYRFDVKTGSMTAIPAAELAELRAMAAAGSTTVYTEATSLEVDQTIFYVSPTK